MPATRSYHKTLGRNRKKLVKRKRERFAVKTILPMRVNPMRCSGKARSRALSGCGYSEDESNILAKIVDALPALQEINMEGNTVSDTARASFEKTCMRNRERAERAAAAAFDLLVPNSAVPPSPWPEELSRVLAQNAPVATLVSLAALIGEDPISLHRMDPSDASGRASDKTS